MSLPQAFSVTATSPTPEVRCIEVSGELDLATVSSLQACVEEGAATDARVIIDLGRCDFIDSSGLACMIEIRDRVEQSGSGRFAICSPHDSVRRIFELTGLSTQLYIAPSRQDALAHLATAAGSVPPA